MPFKNISNTELINLGLAALLTFYLIQFGMDIYWQNTCGHIAIDYCTFWSAGKIANQYGYAKVYDLHLMSEIQRTLFPKTSDISKFVVVPTPYLSVFILPFQLFSLIDPTSGFWLWTILNLAIYFFYIRFFSQETNKEPMPTRLFILFSLSLPAFLNFLYGQVNVWLTICIGEFIRTLLINKTFYAGLWLGGLLIKPQVLILILPILLFRRSFKALAGFAIASVSILGISFGLMGYDGYMNLISLWFGYAGGLPAAIGLQIMMNWRMIGINLNSIAPLWVGWLIVISGLIATFFATIHIWRHSIDFRQPEFGVALLGTFAATGLIAWHSHVSTSMILIPPLIYLSRPRDRLPKNTLLFWAFFPTLLYFVVIILDLLIHLELLKSAINTLLNFLSGFGEFGLNRPLAKVRLG